MFVDEFYFHHKRSLPLWERIGHPLDTLTTLLAFSLPVFFSSTSFNEKAYLALAVFSSIFITKDEFVHKDLCVRTELWLHALLFILHPLTFLGTYLIWKNYPGHVFLKFQFGLTLGFMFYQIIKWSIPWRRIQE